MAAFFGFGDTLIFTTTDPAVELMQKVIDDFFYCQREHADNEDEDEDDEDDDEGETQEERRVRLVATNPSLPVAIAAALHALMRAACMGQGQIQSRDLLLCFTSIMACMTGSGVLQDFLALLSADADEEASRGILVSSLFDSARKEFDSLYRSSRGRDALLHGSFAKLMLPTRTDAAALRNDVLNKLKVKSDAAATTCRIEQVSSARMKTKVLEMKRKGYFDSPAWGHLMQGRLMDAERMSWEMIGGLIGDSTPPLLPLRDRLLTSRCAGTAWPRGKREWSTRRAQYLLACFVLADAC